MDKNKFWSVILRCYATVLLASAIAGCSTVSKVPVNPWPSFLTPAPVALGGVADSIGGYSAGCLRGAQAPPPDGRGFTLMRLTRGHFYGHPSLINFITEFGAKVDLAHLGTVLIGDLAQARGGPTLSGHRSHQTGLDVDIWFWQPIDNRTLTLMEREILSAPSMVSLDGQGLSSEWSVAKEKMLKLAVGFPDVERIFVNPAIKRALCATTPENKREWLRKLRPWWGHAEHFHVRLVCPPGTACTNAADKIPPGDGCDATLAWWFTDEARKKGGTPEGPPAMPVLPAACDDVRLR